MVEETVLVTGGCGFVGTRLVAALKGAGHSVRVLDIPRVDPSHVEAMGARVTQGSVVDGESVRVALGNARVVFHMVAPEPAIDDEAFIRRMVVAGAEVLMEEAEEARVRHVVAASTTGVYAPSKVVRDEGAPLRPRNRLEVAKRDMETALSKGARRTGIRVTCLRLPVVYGAGDGVIVDQLVPEVRHGVPVVLPENGWVSTVHVADVVGAARRLAARHGSMDDERADRRDGEGEDMDADGTFEVLNCVDDRPHTPGELVGAVADAIGVPAPEVSRPGLLRSRRGPWMARERGVRLVEPGRCSSARLKGLLEGWPAFPSLEEGLPGELAPIE